MADMGLSTQLAALEAFPKAVYASQLDRSGRLVETVGDGVLVPVGAQVVTLIIHRGDFQAKSERVLRCRVDLSLDGGKSWSPKADGRKSWPWGFFPVECVTSSGPGINPLTGEVDPTSTLYAPLPDPKNAERQVRVVITPIKDVDTKIELVFDGKV